MKLRICKEFFIVSSIFVLFFNIQANASMAALCNDSSYTQYICCPAKGGWIVSNECGYASDTCVNDTGKIADPKPQVTILQDCKSKGGSFLIYPF